jgi:hypothetical protein
MQDRFCQKVAMNDKYSCIPFYGFALAVVALLCVVFSASELQAQVTNSANPAAEAGQPSTLVTPADTPAPPAKAHVTVQPDKPAKAADVSGSTAKIPLPVARPGGSSAPAKAGVPSKSTDADKPSETTKPDKDTATPVKSVVAAYETPKNLTARDILGARAQGANYKIRQVVERNNYSRIYHVETSFGNFDVVGDGLLKVRLAELDVLNILNERTQAGSFIEAFGTAAISPFKFGGQLLISPLDTVKNSFQGVGNFFDSLETSGENDDPNRGSFVGGLVGVDTAKRELASDLDVDPYTDFKPLADRLKQLASAAGFGGLSVKGAMTAIPGSTIMQSTTMATTRMAVVTASSISTTAALKNALRNKTAGQILRDARTKLKTVGIEDEQIKLLFNNSAYTPSDIYVIAVALEAIKAKDSDLFIEHAIKAENRNEAYFDRLRAEILASWKPPSPIHSFVMVENAVLTLLKNDRLIAAYPIDEFYWTERNAQLAQAISANVKKIGAKGRPLFVVTGDISSKARTEIGKLGWDVARVALLPDEKSKRSEPVAPVEPQPSANPTPQSSQ